MNASKSQNELLDLSDALLGGTITPPEHERLQGLLADDPAARRIYFDYLDMHLHLRQWQKAEATAEQRDEERGARDEERGMAGSPAIDLSVGTAVQPPSGQWPRTPNPEPPVPPIVIDLSSTTHYPLPTSDFVGSWAFSCMVATVIVCVMLLVFWAIKVTPHQHIAEAPSQSVPSEAMPEMVFVGRITGMVDVKWSDDPRYLPPPDFAHVPLDRKYILDSGLLEITYDSGAKVILEGPCTYEVESTAGGYLALGKLTAKVVSGQWPVASAKPQAANQKSEIRNQKSPSSFILHPSSLFFVRTPTAIVTDLGTEFGVEVSENGDVATHVLEGKVEFKVLGDGQRENQTIRISMGESVRLAKGKDGQAATVSLGKADAAAFPIHPGKLAEYIQEQREAPFRRWQAYSQKLRLDPSLVAYYTFETRGREATDMGVILPNVALTGEALDGRIDGPRWAIGRFPGKFALRFTGPDWRDRVELPDESRFDFTGSFSVAIWFKADVSFDIPGWSILIAKGDTSWRLHRFGKLKRLFFDNHTKTRAASQRDIVDGHWHLVVAVFETDGKSGHKRLYLDGRLEGETKSPPATQTNDDPVWLGNNSTYPNRAFCGLIDEAAIFSRPLSGREVQEMFHAGEATAGDNAQQGGSDKSPDAAARRRKGGQPMNGP